MTWTWAWQVITRTCFRTFMRPRSRWETASERQRRMQAICWSGSSRSLEQGTLILEKSDFRVVEICTVTGTGAIPQLSCLRLVEKLFNITKSCSTCCLRQRDKKLQFYKYQSSPLSNFFPPSLLQSGQALTVWKCDASSEIVNYKRSNVGER